MKLQRGGTSILLLLSIAALASCGAKPQVRDERTGEQVVPVKPTVVEQSPTADQKIEDGQLNIQVIGGEAVRAKTASGQLKSSVSSTTRSKAKKAKPGIPGSNLTGAQPNSLYIQIPTDLLGQGFLFGGVITTVSNKTSETLGRLKLTDLPALNVRPYLAAAQGQQTSSSVVLVGCMQGCTETSAQEQLIGLPVVAASSDSTKLVLDVSKFGESLDLLGVLDPGGQATGLKTIATRTTAVDMSEGTIVWDVEHKMIPKDAKPEDHPEETLIGARYYLKLESALNTAFIARKQVPGVGFFTTESGADTLITRWSQTDFNGKPIHYFIKNVPAEHQAAFAASFDDWNKTFNDEIGREMITYEFVPEADAKNALLVPGDVRYNIVEWDLVNVAPYGGLGPSIASQTTGQTFSANVLIQGPTIQKIYKEWFKTAAQAQSLVAEGKQADADALILDARRKILASLGDDKALPEHQVTLGSVLKFRTNAQDERLHDRLASRQDFFDIPQGETYDTYMVGYFKDMLTHELGHNMGLRHNFKGNLFSSADNQHPSQSIMEYLNREFRQKDSIGEYDHMAIRYGYKGVLPTRLDMFCTDEDVVSADKATLSAECSRDDATSDPFAYFGKLIDRVLDKAVIPASDAAPTWTYADLDSNLVLGLTGRIAYATSASTTGKDWKDWAQTGRPQDAAGIKDFVLKTLKDELCAPAIRTSADRKATPEGKAAVAKNLADLDAKVADLSTKFAIGDALKCTP